MYMAFISFLITACLAVLQDNFYTLTVYEKGAEIVRLYNTLLGKEGFRRAPACHVCSLQRCFMGRLCCPSGLYAHTWESSGAGRAWTCISSAMTGRQ